MSFVLFKDSFERYAVGSITGGTPLADNVLSRFTQLSGTNFITATGRNGQCMRSGNSGFAKALPHSARWVLGFAFRLQQAPTGDSEIYRLANNSNPMARLLQDSDGTLSLRAGNSTVVGVTDRALNENRWYFLELDITLSSSTPIQATVELRINGHVEASGSGSTGVNASSNLSGDATGNFHLFSGVPGVGATNDFDDLYIKNEAGYEGDVRDRAVYPDGDGGTSTWTPNSGSSHFTRVNTHPVDLTKWLETATPGNIDLWTFTLPSFSGSIVGVNFSVLARKDDEGTKSFKIVCGPTGTDAESDEFFVSDVTPEYYEFGLKLDPTTGVAWAPGAVITAGVKLIS